MIGYILQGMNFAGLVDYVNKGMGDSKLLASEGVCIISRDAMVDSFVNHCIDHDCNISEPVGHISLSWHPDDADKLNEAAMVKVAQDYMKRMGIVNTQYMLVRHFDTKHPHLHIVYNRVDNDGVTISNSNERHRNRAICKAITQEYGFRFGRGKQNVNRDKLRGKTKTLYKNRDLILAEAKKARSWQDFSDRLSKIGIRISFRYGKSGQGIVGVVFSTKDQSYGGAKLDKDLKFQSLNARFGGELSRISYQPDLHNEHSDNSNESTFIHHLPKASPFTNETGKADSSEPDGTEPTSSNDSNGSNADDFVLIPFAAAMELILQPHQVHFSAGGGGGNNRGWRDKDKDENKNNTYKPRRGGRR